MIVAGCDVGSLTGKAIILCDGEIIASSIVPVSTRPEVTAKRAMEAALAETDLKPEDIQFLTGTGYGRAKIPTADANISEITCHGRGAHWAVPSIRTIVDIGGQDCKVISLDGDGKVAEFNMNDKCAAGTGRFLESMARVLEVKLEDMGPMSLEGENPAIISSQCSVFAESEVITLLAEGVEIADIIAGIHKAISHRIISMARKVGVKNDLTVAGGVAKNAGVVKFLEEDLGEVKRLTVDPQLGGAIGAAVIAQERWVKKNA